MTLLEIFKYIFLGALQGFTEPIPVSSSGHIFILKQIIDTGILNDLNFEIVVNFGSLIAIMYFYRKDILELLKSFFSYIFKKDTKKTTYNEFKYCMLIILGSIPIGIVGLLFKDEIETALSNIKIVGIAFLVTALFLFLVRNIKGEKKDKDLNWKDALIIGLVQVIAVIPGISRSGSTLIAALFRNLKRESAFKYSFMLYIPVSFGTIILGIKELIEAGNLNEILLPYSIGFIVSLVVTFFTIKWFANLVKTGNFKWFSIYCLFLGMFVLIFL